MIIIHAKGNHKIGIGNLSRCFELILYLSKKYKIIGIFECNENLFKKYSQDNIYRSNSIENSLELIKKYKNIHYLCDLVAPDKKLSDSLKKIGVKKIFYFNGLENGFEPDILFLTNGFDYPFEAKGFELYRGFEYYIIGNTFIDNRETKYIPKKQIKNILICFGGADPAYFTEFICNSINDKKYNYTIILGPAMDEKRKEYIKNIKKQNIKYISNPKNMIDLYKSHDMLVTLGGMMTYEAMCLGLPVCAIRWKYLEYIVKNFGKKNMISDLGNIEEAYDNLLNLDLQRVNNIAQNAHNIIDGKALENIKQVIEKYL